MNLKFEIKMMGLHVGLIRSNSTLFMAINLYDSTMMVVTIAC